jgi:2-keto-4-pentenoate hydratase
MISADHNPIGHVISFAGVDEPVRATSANVTSNELHDYHLSLSDEMVTAGPVLIAPVLVLRLAAELEGSHITVVDVMRAIDFVLPGIAVWTSDSRSLLRLVLGKGTRNTDQLDLRLLGVLVDKGSQPVATTCGQATLGDPAAAVAALVSPNGGRIGRALAAGWLVAAGPMTPYVSIHPGEHVVANFAHLGSVGLVTVPDI